MQAGVGTDRQTLGKIAARFAEHGRQARIGLRGPIAARDGPGRVQVLDGPSGMMIGSYDRACPRMAWAMAFSWEG